MRTLLIVAAVFFVFTIMVFGSLVISIFNQSKTPDVEILKYKNSDSDLAWCEKIGQRNASCPGFEAYRNSSEGKAEEERRHIDWCVKIGHVHVNCPLYGGSNPTEHQKKELHRFLNDCENNNHKYVGCPKYNQLGGN